MQNASAIIVWTFSFKGICKNTPNVHVRPMFMKHVLSISVCRFIFVLLLATDAISFLSFRYKKQCFLIIIPNVIELKMRIIVIGAKIENIAGYPLSQQLFFLMKI
jgi:hypothetical protein